MSRQSFIKDSRKFSYPWRVWFWILWLVNLIAPLFFLDRPEAWATLACFFVAAVVIVPLHRRHGWVRVLGVGHLQWLALVPWLVYRYTTSDPAGAFQAWLLTLIVVNSICLVIDLVDITRYIAGDRAPVPATQPS